MRKGFTLAEVLITLGIIGVVASITLPTVIKFYQIKSTEVQLKNTYSTLQQIIKLSEANDVSVAYIAGSPLGLQNWFNDYFSKNLKIIKSCTNGIDGCWHSYGVVKDLSKNNSWDEQSNGMIGNIPLAFVDAQGRFYDMDISSYLTITRNFGVTIPSEQQYSIEIFFDVNGKKKPNIIGKDIYIAIWDANRGLLPAGYDKTQDQVKDNCLNGNGYLCMQYVMQNGWKIDKQVWDRR